MNAGVDAFDRPAENVAWHGQKGMGDAFDEGQRMHEHSVEGYLSVEEQLIETLHILAKQNDTPYVIVAGSALEDLLEIVLRENMRDLSKTFCTDIFESNGLLSTFGAKIRIAYAFKIIDDDLINDFDAINKVRNEFAHARGPIQFGSPNPKLEKAFKKFSGWTDSSDQRALFDERLKACMQTLNSQVESAIFKQAWADE